jgi:hypothetical protein
VGEACAEFLGQCWEFMVQEDLFAAGLLLGPSAASVARGLVAAAVDPSVGHRPAAVAAVAALRALLQRVGVCEDDPAAFAEALALASAGATDGEKGDSDHCEGEARYHADLERFDAQSALLEAGELEAWVEAMDAKRRAVATALHAVLAASLHNIAAALAVEVPVVFELLALSM